MAINTGINCQDSYLGGGIEDCQPFEGIPTGFIAVPKGWSLNKTTDTFDAEYVGQQIQAGNFFPVTDAFSATAETPDPTIETSSRGIQSVVLQGKPTWTVTSKKGLSFHRALYSRNGFGQFDYLIVYENGYIKAAQTPDGKFIKGFTGGMLNTGGYRENNGTESAGSITMFQLTNPLEYNTNVVLLTDLDFDPNALGGVVDVRLEGRADVSEMKIYVKASWVANNSLYYSVFTTPNFKVTVNGVAETITLTAYNVDTKEFALTPTSVLTTTSNIVVSLNDAVANVPATVAIGGKYYRGTTGVFQPVA